MISAPRRPFSGVVFWPQEGPSQSILWMDEVLHHLKLWKPLFVGIYFQENRIIPVVSQISKSRSISSPSGDLEMESASPSGDAGAPEGYQGSCELAEGVCFHELRSAGSEGSASCPPWMDSTPCPGVFQGRISPVAICWWFAYFGSSKKGGMEETLTVSLPTAEAMMPPSATCPTSTFAQASAMRCRPFLLVSPTLSYPKP